MAKSNIVMTCRATLLLGALAAGSACGGTDLVLPTREPAAIELHAGDGQTAAAGTAVPVPPSVVVLDEQGNPIPAATVTFSVEAGGGSVTGASPATDGDGIATVGSWTLGTAVGANRLEASVTAGNPVTGNPVLFSATATPGPASPGESIAQVPTNVFFLDPEPIELETRDQFGNLLGKGGDGVEITAVREGSGTALAVADNGDGTYTASTEGLGPGTYQVEIELNGVPLEDSPFPMRVRFF